MIQSRGETFPTQFSFCITLCYLDQTRRCWLADSWEPQHLYGHLPGPVLRVGEGDSTQNRDCHDQVCVVTNVTKIKKKVIPPIPGTRGGLPALPQTRQESQGEVSSWL